MLICTPAGASDLLERASSLEREGKSEDARLLYIQWLSVSDSSESEQFGRILIHTLRMPAPLSEDLSLIKKHLYRVNSEPDKKDILKTAIILSELSGNQELTQYYLSEFSELETGGSAGSSANSRADLTIARLTLLSDSKYEYMGALIENAESPKLLMWIDRVHQQNPSLITEVDWLYQLYKVLSKEGYSSQAEIFKTRILKDFPGSVEASILNHQVSILSGPEDLFEGAESHDDIEVNPLPVPTVELTYYQAGAFQNYDNALQLKTELEELGLVVLVRKDGAVLKVIVESSNDDFTTKVLNEKGIQSFKIPQLP